MNLHDWIDELCDVLDIEMDFDEALVVDVAEAANDNVKTNAGPIAAFLLGVAAAESDGRPESLERLAALAIDLADRWEKTAEEVLHEDDDPEVELQLAAEG